MPLKPRIVGSSLVSKTLTSALLTDKKNLTVRAGCYVLGLARTVSLRKKKLMSVRMDYTYKAGIKDASSEKNQQKMRAPSILILKPSLSSNKDDQAKNFILSNLFKNLK